MAVMAVTFGIEGPFVVVVEHPVECGSCPGVEFTYDDEIPTSPLCSREAWPTASSPTSSAACGWLS